MATDDFAAALESDASRKHFVIVDNDEALEAMLDAPLERWRIFLHPSQRQLVERAWSGPVRVLGGAGTGKTVVAMHRAAWLAQHVYTGERDRILFTTFTKNLAEDIAQNVDKLLEGAPRKRVEVLHLDAWVTRFLKANGYDYTIDYWREDSGAMAEAWTGALALAPDGFSPGFFREEWERVVLAGRFRLQVSLRERPTLLAAAMPMQPQAYFSHLEFESFDVRSLRPIEKIAEKVRAAFQRAKVRDLYDLHRFATKPFDGELLRRLVVLKLWQVQDPFSPDAFFQKLRSGSYEWEDLHRLLRMADRVEPDEILNTVETRFAVLRNLTGLEQALIADARSGWNEPLAERLRAEIRQIAGGG